MRWSIRNLPIRRKLILIIVATSAMVLVLAGIFSLAVDYSTGRGDFLRHHTILARVTASNSTAILAFSDRRGASALLQTLAVESNVVNATLFGPSGEHFATYQRSDTPSSTLPSVASEEEHYRFDASALELWEPVSEGGRRLGTLYLKADLSELHGELLTKAGWLFFCAIIACVIASLLAMWLQRSVSEPILELAHVAESVHQEGVWEFRGRPEVSGNDEIAVLTHSFLEMLDGLRQREGALQESEANYRMLTEQASDGIIISDREGRILSVNQAALELLGYERSELLQRKLQDFGDDQKSGLRRFDFAKLAEGDSVLAESQLIHKAGHPIWVETNAKTLEDGRIQAILRDISERKRLEDQLRQAQKMEAIGQLAGGVAHDFNNLLTVIGGSSQHLLGRSEDEEMREELCEIRDAASRAADLTRQLLAFSRLQIPNAQVIDLNESLRGLERMLGRIIEENVEIVTELDPELGAVRADPGQVEQVIVNLVVNARDAMPAGGKVQLQTRNVEVGASPGADDDDLPPGSYVRLAVQDEGHGISPEHLPHIFEPFFTTKDRGKGTGLGLSTLYGIVQQAGGHVRVSSELNLGTTFRIYFPRLEELPDTAGETNRRSTLPKGSECVLLVEDEDAVRRFTKRILGELGYTVLEASNGTEALEVAAAFDGEIDLLFTDLVMPGMNGGELVEALLRERPRIRVIIATGYPGEALDDMQIGIARPEILAKPFDATLLAARIRDVLDADDAEV